MNTEKRPAILVVSAGIMQIPALERARALGYYVIASDRNPNAPGFQMANECLVLDVKDVEGHVRWAREHGKRVGLKGAFAGADVAITVAAVCQELALPGVPVEVAMRSNNKALMKERWLCDKIPTPWSAEAATLQEAQKILKHTGFPAIVKAVDGAASRGSMRIDRLDQLSAAFKGACATSRTGTAIIEQFVVGKEQSVESIVWKGKHYHVSLADRHFGFAPFAIETAHVDPSNLDKETQQRICEVVDAAADSLGIDFGPAKADMILTDQGPMILEMPARLSGGFHSQYTTPLSTGKDPITAVMKMAMGEALDNRLLVAKQKRTSICAGIFPEPGIIKSISGIQEAQALPGIEQILVTKAVGDRVEPMIDNGKRCCWVIAVGESEPEAWSCISAARQKIRFETVP
ncbi:MAG: ATP-grasp domain-containing protein [Trichloromonadaceae bacterium]